MRVLFFKLAFIDLGKRKESRLGGRKEKREEKERSQNDQMRGRVHVSTFPVEPIGVDVLKNLRGQIIVHLRHLLDSLPDP